MRWFEAMEARPAVQRNNKMAAEIRERMNKAAEAKTAMNIYDTKDNAERDYPGRRDTDRPPLFATPTQSCVDHAVKNFM